MLKKILLCLSIFIIKEARPAAFLEVLQDKTAEELYCSDLLTNDEFIKELAYYEKAISIADFLLEKYYYNCINIYDLFCDLEKKSLDENILKYVLELIAKNVDMRFEYLPVHIYTPVHMAVSDKNKQVLKLLIRAKAYLDSQKNICCETPLHVAASLDHSSAYEIFKLLLDAGAKFDDNLKDYHDKSIIYRAGINANPEIVTLIRERHNKTVIS